MRGLNFFLHAGSDLPQVWITVGFSLRAALSAFFLFLAWKNLSGDLQMAADFQRWGYPSWFQYGVALAQIFGALLLVPTATCFLGGALLSGILLGALVTHLIYDPVSAILSPLAFLLLVAGTTAWFRPEILQ